MKKKLIGKVFLIKLDNCTSDHFGSSSSNNSSEGRLGEVNYGRQTMHGQNF